MVHGLSKMNGTISQKIGLAFVLVIDPEMNIMRGR